MLHDGPTFPPTLIPSMPSQSPSLSLGPLMVQCFVQSPTGTPSLWAFPVTEPWGQNTLGRRKEGFSQEVAVALHLLTCLS